MTRLFVTGAGAVCFEGLGVDTLRRVHAGQGRPWDEELLSPAQAVRIGRVGRLQDPESAAAYDRWGQIDTYSRYGFSVTRQVLAEASLLQDPERRLQVGVVLGTAWGCVEENQRFERWDVVDGKVVGAAPIVFKVTVDNAPAGWAAVAFGLRGPTETFVSGDGAAFEAVWSAESILRRGVAPALVVGGVERFVDLHLALAALDPTRHGAVLSEGAGAILVERDDFRPGRRVLSELLGVGRACGTFAEGAEQLLRRCEIPHRSVVRIVAGGPAAGQDARASFPGAEVIEPKALLGEPHGAYGGWALALAAGAADGPARGPGACTLVHGHGEGEEQFFVLLRVPEDR